jgi:hypothetical protein
MVEDTTSSSFGRLTLRGIIEFCVIFKDKRLNLFLVTGRIPKLGF